MDRHEVAERNAVALRAADEVRLDRALEDSFPASDPLASNLFD